MKRQTWTRLDVLALEALYPHVRTERIAEALGHTLASCYNMARKLGLCKSEKYLASPEAGRLRRDNSGGIPFRFQKGHVSWNKGQKRPGWSPGRMKETQFRKGQRPYDWKPLGSLRFCDGYLQIKLIDTGYPPDDWRPFHVEVWKAAHGPLPPKHCVVFRDADKLNFRVSNLECISRGALMSRNTVHNLPPELKSVIMLNGALKRRLRRLSAEEQTDGSAESPVRDNRAPEG
jgi:hypothetical protein